MTAVAGWPACYTLSNPDYFGAVLIGMGIATLVIGLSYSLNGWISRGLLRMDRRRTRAIRARQAATTTRNAYETHRPSHSVARADTKARGVGR